jgi:subtilase family serine protease
LLAGGSTTLGQYPPNSRYTLSDTTGDGQADLVVQWLPGNGVNRLTVWQGNGLDFSRSGDRNPYRDETTRSTALSLDFNGDGRGDFVFVPRDADQDPNASELSTRLLWLEGAPEGLLSTRHHDGGFGIWSQNVDFLAGDADGDGRDDVLRIWKDEDDMLQVTTWRSVGSSHDDWRFEESTTHILADALASQQFVAADVDGDGRTDLLQIGQDDEARAIARVWLAGEAGYAAAGGGVLGAWLAEAHYFSLPGLGGAADLVRSAADGEGAARFDRWRYVGGLASGDSLLLSVTQPLPPSAGSGNFDWGPFYQSENTAPQADLTIGSVRIAPPGNWSPGELVTVSWNTTNAGTLDIDHTWSERLEVYNDSTGELLATRTVVQDLPALASGESSTRRISFVWPDGTTGSGRIIFRILVDDHHSVSENNAGGTGEANNESSYSVANAPDLRVINLHTLPGVLFAGDELHIFWEDRNDGSSATQAGWNDHLLIRNRATGEILLDAAVPYDPAQPGNGRIAAGASRLRSQVFRLPEGVQGVGEIEISVSTDEGRDGHGALLEINTRGDAESNNRAVTVTTATARPYADLRVDTLVAPSSAIGTLPISVSWSVSNQGATDADQDWTDQIVYSTDALIGDADDVVIASVRHSGGLRVGEGYSQTAEVTIPVRSAGRYHLGIRSDSGAEVPEPDTRADNHAARAIDIVAPYADLVLDEVNAPRLALSGETIVVTWVVRNEGNVTTNRPSWSDRVVLSTDPTLSADDLVLAGAVAHAGALAAGQSTTGRATITLPRDLAGDYFVIVNCNAGRSVDEAGLTLNNTRASSDALAISLSPTPDLTATEVIGPSALRPGDTASLRYTVSNSGAAATSGSWRDRIYIDRAAQGGLLQVATALHANSLQAGGTLTQTVDFVLPGGSPEGEFRWLVRTDADNSVYERHGEDNNEAAATVQVARPDLVVSEVRAPALARSGDRIAVEWRVGNQGASASGDWVDTVYLVQGTLTRPLADVAHAAGLAAGASYTASAAFDIPLECDGDYQLVVVSDSGRRIDDHEHNDNRSGSTLHVDRAPYADLVVSEVSAPAQVIGDPARVAVSWRVDNQGIGAGRSGAWSDRVVFSADTVLGNADDRVVGEYRHVGALAAGESYAGTAEILLPPATAARYRLFVVTDAQGEVFENFAEANNVGRGTEVLDVMPIPYADLQVASVGMQGTPASGRPLRVTWEVINRGIGISNSAEWSDQVWLSRHADGSDVVASFGSARHIGQLAVGDRYGRSLDVVLPEGISGNYYLNVRTGGPFEFIFGNNNSGSSAAMPVSLSASPDLVVEKVELPATAHEGASIDISWSVLNQGEAAAGAPWIDSLWLLPVGDEGQAIALGSFGYDHGLDPGMRYTRTEQVRLPAKIDGLYRVKVVTNANLGSGRQQVYEHGAARENNVRSSTDLIEVVRDERPDLRVTAVSVPEHVVAGTGAAIRYTISNFGATASNGRWTDKVYFSLDAKLSADDRLVGQFDNAGALAPGEAYTNETALIDIPIRQRGEAYLIVVADGSSQVDEYPNEGNNVRAAHLTIDPLPFADLVTSAVVAPDQAVHGASIEVRYRVTNHGSAATRGESAALDTWTDSVWLARDKRRPGAYKGDILLASFTHIGKLGGGEDYLATAQVTIPDETLSGQYYLTVWSDTYDVVLEDTLATHINPDDPSQIENNNYLARPISILGVTPPDLVISEVVGPEMASAGDGYTFSYTVENRGERFTGSWVDAVYLTDDPDWNVAREIWSLGNFAQNRSLGNGEKYTLTQTLPLAPSVSGRHLVVRTDVSNQVGETGESNNSRAAASLVTPQAADLRVTELRSEASASSGEETTVTWTVGNFGAAVWSGTRAWVDAVYLSRDPEFIPERAIPLGTFNHANLGGLAAGGSYTSSARVRLPAGSDGRYYLYLITDAESDVGDPRLRQSRRELTSGDNANARESYYARSAYEGARHDNNLGRALLDVAYREPDLQIDEMVVSDRDARSGTPITVTWTVSNRGTRQTRSSTWFDGLYLSRDASLDDGDYPLLDRGSPSELSLGIRSINLTENGQPKYLQVGESYTASATFNLPDSISGDFHLIVRADTAVARNSSQGSTIRDGLPGLGRLGDGTGTLQEFRDEGNNQASATLSVTLATPPDLQVSEVGIPTSVLAGQPFSVNWRVRNAGGDTPDDQIAWNDLVYLSRDRFLDLDQDRYLGYLAHQGALTAAGSYDAHLQVSAPSDLEGPYYLFVISDPARAWGSGETGKVREFGHEQNNAATAPQPILVEAPPPADLTVTQVLLPASAGVGDEIRVDFTIGNDSINTAYGRWTDAIYLSADNTWDLGDRLIGMVEHVGDLPGHGSYSGTLSTPLPPIRDGNWRVIVRPDLFNEVFEGRIAYTASGLALPPGEVNNRMASGATLQVRVPELPVGSLVTSTLSPGEARVYKISVAAGETLRVSLDAAAAEGSNEIYLRYGDLPTGTVFDAAYSNPVAADQEALVPSTRAGDYYLLVRARQGVANSPISLRADLLPLSITRITPDHGGTGDDAQRWITLDIHGSHFLPGALVKLSRPGIAEVEPDRWQVLDATHIRAVFDSRGLPHGLYDLTIINPDGQRVTEAERYLVERGVETEVTLGIGGPRTLATGESATYSVSLQNLGNLDTPYVRFDFGVPEMGVSADVLEGLQLPYLVFGSSVGGRPDGRTVDLAGNTRSYGTTPRDGTARGDIPWARLDGADNDRGSNLAPGYVFDLQAGGFVGTSFTLQTYPGLAEWLAYDFAGLRNRLYALRPDWQEQGLLDGGVADLDRIADGLSRKFLSRVPDEHLSRLEALALPFRFDVAGAATPLTRDEFIADQQALAQKLRAAILADSAAPPSLAALAADAVQWQTGWLAALEAAGLLRPLDEAPPIRDHPQVLSPNATLATGILLGKGGDSYRTEADILGFFSKVQTWYGDTAGYAGDTHAAQAPVDYLEVRQIPEGSVEIPVPAMADAVRFDLGASHATHFIDFNIFVGGQSELEYLRHIGVLDEDFKAVAGQALDLGRYLQQAAAETAAAATLLSVRGPQVLRGDDGQGYVPADTPLPFNIAFSNPSETPAGQLRLVSQLDPSLEARSFRLGDIRIGDIQVHLPADQASFQGDFDFTASKGFILRISAGVEPSTGIATWLLQAIDPDSGEVLRDATRGLLAGDLDGASNAAADASGSATDPLRRGFASYSVRAATSAAAGSEIAAADRLLVDAAPPIDSEPALVRLDTRAPQTTLKVTTLTSTGAADTAPSFDLQWNTVDEFSGVMAVTLYVAEDAGDFRIWQRQLSPQTTQALFTGETGKHYEFLAVATDRAGNRETAVVANAVLPDDGARQEVLDGLGVNATLAQTASTPLAPTDRSYPSNPLFTEASRQLPGLVASSQRSDLRAVLAPFSVRGFAEGYRASAADIGAQALLEMPDHSILASAGPLRNEVYHYGKNGLEAGSSGSTPLFTLDAPILDMAVDALGQLWVMTGAELLQIDAADGAIVRRLKAPGGDPLTHALAIDPQSGKIYVSSGRGIEIYNPAEADPARAWRHFSTQRVGDLAFAPDGRLWAVKWSGSEIAGAALTASSEILSFPMSGRDLGRAELEYRLPGIIDSIAFGAADTPLAGLLLASSQLGQRPVVTADEATPHQSAVWMIELASRERLQLASGGTRGETIVATHDGRVLVAETGRIDEIAPWRAPLVKAVTVPDGALLPLPLNTIGVVFDQDMWIADADHGGSVLNVDNYTLSTASDSTAAASSQHPAAIRWDAGTRTAWLDIAGLQPGEYRLHIANRLQSAAETPLRNDFETRFTALRDLGSRVRLDFSHTRADRATGQISYDVSVTNIGSEAIEGPLTLLLDPGQHFAQAIAGATAGDGDQGDLWLLDLGSALQALGGRLPAGATIADQTVSIIPGNRLAGALSLRAGMAELVKANLGHGIYALPQDTLPPTLSVAGESDADELPPAQVGEAWSAQIEAFSAGDATRLYWQLLDAPAGVSLTPSTATDGDADTQAIATLSWTPDVRAAAASEIRVRIEDSRGGFAWRRFRVAVAGGNHAPTFEPIEEFTLKEGETLSLPLRAADADGDDLTQLIRNLPPGATFDAASGLLSWTPGYDQAGVWSDITHVVSDGKAISSRNLAITVEQAYPTPVLDPLPAQALREGEAYARQLAGFVPGRVQADGSTLRLEYGAPWLPGGATLNAESGWLAWTPSYDQHGRYAIPVTLTAIWTATDGAVSETRIGRELVLEVANANGAPIFEPAETWNVVEGQPLRVSVFAFDPDNPEFAPKVRLRPGAEAVGPDTTPATVAYEISGLPPGAVFDAETLEIAWTPAYDQAGSYAITVTATDDGDPSSGMGAATGAAAVSRLHLPIVVSNANRAPSVADIPNTFVERGGVIEIPVFAEDADARLADAPITLSFSGLPRFVRFIENSALDSTHGPVAGAGEVRGVLRVTPGEGDRGDYTITITASDRRRLVHRALADNEALLSSPGASC